MAIQLASQRLILNEVKAQDLAAVHSYASDPEVVRYQSWGPYTRVESEAFVQQLLRWQREEPRNFIILAIRRKEEPTMLGAVSLELDEDMPYASFGFSLARQAWGQGFATEAGLTLITYAHEALRLTRLTASCDRRNTASQKVLRKCGFEQIGLIHDHLMLRDGLRDTLLFERLLPSPPTSP